MVLGSPWGATDCASGLRRETLPRHLSLWLEVECLGRVSLPAYPLGEEAPCGEGCREEQRVVPKGATHRGRRQVGRGVAVWVSWKLVQAVLGGFQGVRQLGLALGDGDIDRSQKQV